VRDQDFCFAAHPVAKTTRELQERSRPSPALVYCENTSQYWETKDAERSSQLPLCSPVAFHAPQILRKPLSSPGGSPCPPDKAGSGLADCAGTFLLSTLLLQSKDQL